MIPVIVVMMTLLPHFERQKNTKNKEENIIEEEKIITRVWNIVSWDTLGKIAISKKNLKFEYNAWRSSSTSPK